MPFKSGTLFLLLTLFVCKHSFSNTTLKDTGGIKLPNTVMYELIDCAHNNTLNDFMERHLVYPVKNKQLVPLYGSVDERLATTADSTNKLVLAQIVDSLRKYDIKRTDLVKETFSWTYRVFTNATTNASKDNHFKFVKGEHVFVVDFYELRSSQAGWRIIREVVFAKRNTSDQNKTNPLSSNISVDPTVLGARLAKLLQAGKLEEVFQYFPTKKVMEPFYKDNVENLQGVFADVEETKNDMRRSFYTMKPGSFQVRNEYMNIQRNSDRPKDMDKGYYQFALTVAGVTKRFNLKFNILNDKIYVWRFTKPE